MQDLCETPITDPLWIDQWPDDMDLRTAYFRLSLMETRYYEALGDYENAQDAAYRECMRRDLLTDPDRCILLISEMEEYRSEAIEVLGAYIKLKETLCQVWPKASE